MGNFAMVTLNCAESNYEPKYHEPIKKQTCMEIDANAEEFITNQLKDILQ